jgi:hypothetical protein
MADARRLLKATIALFGVAFATKYLLLANLTAPEGLSWWQRITENPGKEAVTYLLDLPRYAETTGYVQFLALLLYLLGLYLTPTNSVVAVDQNRFDNDKQNPFDDK